MAGLINELIEVLKNQAKNYEELLILSKEKRKVIIENDTDMLQKITQAENIIIGRNQRMESKRQSITKDIANVLNQDIDSLTLGALAQLIKNQEEYGQLQEIRQNLKETLHALKSENDRNSLLINSSLEYINFSVNLLRQSPFDDDLYPGKRRSVAPGNSTSFFDAKR